MASQKEQIAELKAQYLEYFKELPVQRYAAMYVSRDEDTILRWKAEDTEFAERVNQLRAQWVAKKVSKAKVEFALERLEKSAFRESKEIEVTVPQPILGGITKDGQDQSTDSSVQ
jgi:hypothetical protein